MIDIHTHLLPGVDDGSRSVEVSRKVLERFAQDGVEVLVCTPHLNASAAATAPHAVYAELFAELVAQVAAPPELRLGWEIMLDEPNVDLRAPYLALGNSTALLVEFPRTGVPGGAAAELFRIRMSGRVPVLAHPERYWGCTIEQVHEWRRVGAVIQTDAIVLIGSGEMSRLAKSMLEEGLIDVVASDNHGDARSQAIARDWLVEVDAGEQARMLTHINPRRLLANEPVLPVGPVRVDRPMLQRLKELVFGR